MLVIFDKNSKGERQADFVAIGLCLRIEDGADVYRIALTQSQWEILAELAERKARLGC